MQVHTLDGADPCRVHVPPSRFPVEATVAVDKGGQVTRRTAFYVRIGNGTREITDWPSGSATSPAVGVPPYRRPEP